MRDPRRPYEAYEEFGERLERAHEAMADVHGQLVNMWLEVDKQGATEPSWYADRFLRITCVLKDLQREVAQEFQAEIESTRMFLGTSRGCHRLW